jgi:uncharacterized Ntn-hydrolase superfamily protein
MKSHLYIIKTIIIFLIFNLLFNSLYSQDTFSICAVDPVTGQVGSAGATCIANSATSAILISDVHPVVGVIHTQASYLAGNQNLARSYMNQGWTPQQIIDSIVVHDIQGNPLVRQYGVVSLDSGGLSAAYTGINCMDYKNHITGPTYSIQGNILLGQQILDSMESGFLNTNGTLACKLMAALQGAKVIGADTRCAPNGISTYSAFLRVANSADAIGNFYLDLTVNTYPNHIEPIDTLQSLFDAWGGCTASYILNPSAKPGIKYFPNPVTDYLQVESSIKINAIKIYNMNGCIVKELFSFSRNKTLIDLKNLPSGIYSACVLTEDNNPVYFKIVKSNAL